MPVAYVVETEQWDQLGPLLDAMQVTPDSLDTRAAVTVHVGRGLAAAQQDELSAAKAALEQAKTALGESDDEDLRIQVRQLDGLVAMNAGNTDQALAHLKEAAAIEAQKPLEFGPPFPPKPAHELYGEALLALDRPADALTQFEKTLARHPDRARALMGKAKAAAQAGRTELASETRAALSDQWSNADAALQTQLQSLSGTATSSTSDAK
jgi:tetratricopeptide (TPR) repeat protein